MKDTSIILEAWMRLANLKITLCIDIGRPSALTRPTVTILILRLVIVVGDEPTAGKGGFA